MSTTINYKIIQAENEIEVETSAITFLKENSDSNETTRNNVPYDTHIVFQLSNPLTNLEDSEKISNLYNFVQNNYKEEDQLNMIDILIKDSTEIYHSIFKGYVTECLEALTNGRDFETIVLLLEIFGVKS